MVERLLLAGLVVTGCSGDPGIPRTATEAQLEPQRQACAFTAGSAPAQTIGVEYPVGDALPFKHIIVLMEENRSFDDYFGQLVADGYYQGGDFSAGGTGFAHADQVDVPPAGWSNPDGAGGTVDRHLDDEHCFGVKHSWQVMHDNYDNGLNDHFVINNNPDGQRVLSYVDDTVIPFYYALANTFSMGDRYFASVMTSTWPNRFFLMAGTSFGLGDNSFDWRDTQTDPSPQIFTALENAGRTWKDYTDGPHMEIFFPNFGFLPATTAHYGNVKCDLMNDIMNDTLPDVAFIMGDEIDETSDEDPTSPPGIGGELFERVIRLLWASPAWKDTVLFYVFDENGGMADHVQPVPACAPDGYPAQDQNGTPLDGGFAQTGFRVPFVAISPYAKAHFVSHQIYDHTSITRFIEARYGLPAMTARDANALPPFEMFDFDHPAFLTPPDISVHTTVDDATLAACNQMRAPVGCE